MRQHKRTVSEGKNKQHFKYDKDGRYEIIIEERKKSNKKRYERKITSTLCYTNSTVY